MANTYLQRTTSTPTSDKKGTISFWVKKCGFGDQHMANIYIDASNRFMIKFQSDDTFVLYNQNSGTGNLYLESSAKFRDTSAFYHVVCKIDTTQGTASDRAAVYINGSEMSYAVSTYPNQNDTIIWFQASKNQQFGQYNSSNYLNGVMSHIHYTDGYVYDASTFGSTDATTGEWKINTSPSITMGNNGFTILKDGNTITDQSSNSNDFTLGGGTLTNTEDCPSNVFATFNVLNNNSTLTNGNLTAATDGSQKFGSSSTLGVSSGKFYWEMKVNATYLYTGVDYDPAEALRNNDPIRSHGWCYNADGSIYNNGSGSSFGDTFTTGDIIGVALDATNSKLYFAKNGVWQNSGNPESGSTGTGAVSITANETYFAVMGDGGSSVSSGASANFGNGFFGTTQISSEGTNASGIGKFEYNVPANFTALSTKGLNE